MAGKRPVRILIAALAAATLVAAYVRFRFEARKPDRPPSPVARVREALSLDPVLAAEEALRARPEDPTARLRLADACARTNDPVGAALALWPLSDRANRIDWIEKHPISNPVDPVDPVKEKPEILSEVAVQCARIGWLEEVASVLRRLQSPPAGPRLELAAAYALRGEAARAEPLLEALERERADGLDRDGWLDGAMTWYQCRRPERAAAWARRGVALAPEDPAARMLLARCLLAARQPEEALAALSTGASPLSAGNPQPGDGGFEYWRARAALRCRDAARREAAREHLAHLGMGDPPNPVAAFEAGRDSLISGQPSAATALLSRAARDHYQEVLAYGLLTESYTALGQAAKAAWARGRAQTSRGYLDRAQDSLRQSIALDPAPEAVHLDLARVLLLAGKPNDALEVLQRAQDRHPESVELALGKAEVLNQLDRFAEQARELETAAARDAGRAHEALRNLGRMYYETRQFDRVIPVLTRAVQLPEADAESHRYLGLCYALRPEDPARVELALNHLLRAVQLQPGDAVAWTSAGSLLQRTGHPAEAAACYRRAIAGDPESPGAYVALARALQREGRRAEGTLLLKLYRERERRDAQRRQWENRITADRVDVAAHYAMGDSLLRYVGYRRAFPYLLIAASLRPDWKQAQARLADACALIDYLDLWHQAERAAR